LKKFLAATYLWVLLLPVVFIVLGAASNQLAVIANHDVMPVLMNEARIQVSGGAVTIGDVRFLDPKHSVMDEHTHLTFLCDIIDVGDIESIGDLGIDFGQWMWDFAPFLWGSLLCLKVYKLTV
jgi:hypothetical protein